ncbi:Hypothetical predicted protein [Mytilus galloprovincialis]|uniref:CCHC-type domain-containing protein n=1 Tax=Mytilus galloprovincialis TaxID=29158 RepID=A0A8B6E5Q9_MYTGA|nr:Hypothetical predicted protein [Mytilus galloprovincialis]
MDPMDIETNVKRIVGEEIQRSQNDFLSKLDGIFTSRLQAFGNQQKERSEAQMCKLQSDILTAYKFQKKSCEDQFKFNKKMNATFKEAESCLDSSDDKSAHAKQRISEGIELLAYRQKLVKMADSCEHGWRVVQEYTSNSLANDSEDDRKIMRATSRAERKAKVEKSRKKRSTPYSRPSTSADNGNNSGGAKSARRPGVCYNCYKPGHWQFECPEKNKKLSTHSNLLSYNDVYRNSNSLSFFIDESLTLKTAHLNNAHLLDSGNDSICSLNREECVDQLSRHLNTPTKLISPVGKLYLSIHKWKQAGATDYILQVIEKGYGIPFKVLPENVFLPNK